MDLDSIDEKTAFKMGFASRCFEMGLEPDQVKAAMEKSARFGWLLKTLKNPWITVPLANAAGMAQGFGINGAINAAKDISGGMIGLGGGLGLLGGAGIGYGLARMNEQDVDEDEIKSKELADTYKVYTDRLKAQKAYQQYRRAREAS